MLERKDSSINWFCSVVGNEVHYIHFKSCRNAPQVMQSMRTSSLVCVRVSTLMFLALLAVLLTASGCNCHPHVASVPRLPMDFVYHEPHHQTDDPAFRVFYGTGVSLYRGIGALGG